MNLPEIKNFFSICRSYTFHYLNQGPDLEIKIASQTNPSSEENSPPQSKTLLSFMKRFSKFAKGIYETCDCNFFNFALIIVFSIVQLISFLHFASNN